MCTRVQARANLYGILCVAVWPRYALLQSLADLGQMPNTPTASDVARHQRTNPKAHRAPRLAFPASRTELEHPHTLCRVRRDVRRMALLCSTGEEYLAACAAEPIQRPDVRGDLLGAYGRSAGLVR